MDARGRPRPGILAAIVLGVLLLLPGSAAAYSTAPGYSAQDYANGFPESSASGWGPIGITFDQSDNLYVADPVDGNIYRFQPGGGTASAATRLTSSPISGGLTGLVVSSGGQLYAARYHAGDVVQVDPGTGRVVRTVAQIPCATGLALDPASGDLFVSQNQCGATIYRVSGLQSGSPTVSAYATAHGVDGIAFDQDGTLYAESDGHVLEIDGTDSSSPGAVTDLATVPHADGLVFGAHASGGPPFLVANRNDGIVTRVDFGQSPPAQSDIFSGGSRGDFAAVDSAGCLYITQSSSIVRISPDASACAFEPTTPGTAPAPGVVATTVASTTTPKASHSTGCRLMKSLTLRLRQRGRVRLRSAIVYVNGRRVRRLRGRSVDAPIVLRGLPKRAITVRVVAFTTKGRRLVTIRRYTNCSRPPRRCPSASRLVLPVPHRRGARVVLVAVYLNGHRVRVVHGRRIASVSLSRLPPSGFAVRLVTRDSRGRRSSAIRRFAACGATLKRTRRHNTRRKTKRRRATRASAAAAGAPSRQAPPAPAPSLACVTGLSGLADTRC